MRPRQQILVLKQLDVLAGVETHSGLLVLPHLPEADHALRRRFRQPAEIGKGGIEALARGARSVRARHDQCLHRRPAQAGGFAHDQDRIGPLSAHEPIGDGDRHLGEGRQRRHRFLVLPSLQNEASIASVRRPARSRLSTVRWAAA